MGRFSGPAFTGASKTLKAIKRNEALRRAGIKPQQDSQPQQQVTPLAVQHRTTP